MRATVVYVNYERGWCFAATDESPSRKIFVHSKEFGVFYTFSDLSRGSRIECREVVDDPKGLHALGVTVLGHPQRAAAIPDERPIRDEVRLSDLRWSRRPERARE